MEPAEFGAEGIAAFARAREDSGYRRWRTVASLRLLLTFLRGQGLLPAEPPRRQGPVEVVLERYRLWLRRERRLGGQTIGPRAWVAVTSPKVIAEHLKGNEQLPALAAAQSLPDRLDKPSAQFADRHPSPLGLRHHHDPPAALDR